MYLTYEEAIKLPLKTRIYSETLRERFEIIYNLWKLIVKRVRSDWELEKRTKELSKNDIETNYYH